jgi:site-specific recombinase XerD
MYNEGGVDVRTLKDILGHEQLNTTQIYTHVSDKKLQKAMDANPLAEIGNSSGKKTKEGTNT